METKLYYLESRYYDPETGRFISAPDKLYQTGTYALNCYIFRNSNPIAGFNGNNFRNHNTSPFNPNSVLDIYLFKKRNILEPVPSWVPKATAFANTGFEVSLMARVGWYFLKYPEVSDLMRLDGLIEIPGKYTNLLKGLGYAFLALEVGLDIYSNIQQGQDAAYIAASAGYTALSGIGIMWASAKISASVGALLGGGLPGALIGGIIGCLVGLFLTLLSNQIKEVFF